MLSFVSSHLTAETGFVVYFRLKLLQWEWDDCQIWDHGWRTCTRWIPNTYLLHTSCENWL